jgi:uncharacterized protein (TIGR00369 family)
MTANAGLADAQQRLAEITAATPFFRYVGLELDRLDDGFARVRLPFKEENCTAGKALHGGVIAALLDLAGSMAAWSTADPRDNRLRGMTLSCQVSFLSGALGEEIFGEGRVLRRGKEIIYSDVFVVNGEGKQLAQGSHIYRIAGRAP